MTITRGGGDEPVGPSPLPDSGWAGSGAPPRPFVKPPSLGRDFLIDEVQVYTLRSVEEIRHRIPDGTGHNHADHEGQRQAPGYGERRVDRVVEDEHEHHRPEDQHT